MMGLGSGWRRWDGARRAHPPARRSWSPLCIAGPRAQPLAGGERGRSPPATRGADGTPRPAWAAHPRSGPSRTSTRGLCSTPGAASHSKLEAARNDASSAWASSAAGGRSGKMISSPSRWRWGCHMAVGTGGYGRGAGRAGGRGRPGGPGGSNRVGRIGQGGRIGCLGRVAPVWGPRATGQPLEWGGRRVGMRLDVRFDLAGLSGAPDSTRLAVGYAASLAGSQARSLAARSLQARTPRLPTLRASAGECRSGGRRGGVGVATWRSRRTAKGRTVEVESATGQLAVRASRYQSAGRCPKPCRGCAPDQRRAWRSATLRPLRVRVMLASGRSSPRPASWRVRPSRYGSTGALPPAPPLPARPCSGARARHTRQS